MKLKLFFAAACVAALPLAAQAQGIPEGASYGFNTGNRMAGPVGAVVGGVVGGVTGGINGMLGVDPRAADVQPQPVAYRHQVRHIRHHRYYRRHHHH
jgi:hypothetical protein